MAFLGYLYGADYCAAVAVLFILAMCGFVVALLLFLREVSLAINSLRFGLAAEAHDEPPAT